MTKTKGPTVIMGGNGKKNKAAKQIKTFRLSHKARFLKSKQK